ncbi:ATP-binding protein [Spongiibacter taiwanensis]|uniref:sensor histidine kinase n=1 Tax=Spongiibacter taiwanensis TaxID=1748242 RepID=UPI0020355B99|nr:ATP-binding protein [Spongiibacter taiwanensis]USA42090.1 ATP-binding protein [Spongiibacter taiwanensis]
MTSSTVGSPVSGRSGVLQAPQVSAAGGILKRLLSAFSIFTTLGVLVYLLWQTLANPLETGLHVVRSEQLENVASAEADLNDEVVEARLNLDSPAVALADARSRYAAAGEALSAGQAGMAGLDPTLTDLLARFERAAKEKRELVDDYLEQQERLVLLFGAMRDIASQALSAEGIAGTAALREEIVSLVSEATIHSVRSDSNNLAELEQAFSAIALSASRIEDSEAQSLLSRLFDTTMSLRYTRDELQALMAGIESIASAEALAALRSQYSRYFETLQYAADKHRQTLAVFAVSLLAAFALIAWRLRLSFSALDRVNGELQDTNNNLELIVESRTVELREALSNVRAQQAQLIQSEKMASLGQMVAGVAHEINTPLGYANSNVEMVRESLEAGGELDQETLGEFAMLLSDAEYGLSQIADLVLSLKDFSRVDRSKTERFDLNEGVETALKICQNQLKTGIDVVRDFAELPRITCAPSQLNQVFLNLINNAAQAMSGQGELAIRSWQEGDQVFIAFKDSGCGMDEQTQAHIFEPFFTTKAVGEGTGLGLSIVFRIIEDHGGNISVSSSLGEGTEFTIRLPVDGASGAAAAARDTDIVTSDDESVLLDPQLA